jgi:isoamylase
VLPRSGQRRHYRLEPADLSRYVDTTGCGNSLNAGDPVTLQLIMDSLRYWLTQMHVDGFRFDLAPALAGQEGGFDQMSAFFDLVSQDPVVSRAKLIAEPWDVGQMDSYDLGRFPPLWREWNGRYRDTMRDFWRSHDVGLGEFATRFSGSADLYAGKRRRPTASVNLITVHDGFTLRNLVSYEHKHNEANGESNRDGTDDNRSWNCGAEGPSDDPTVVALRTASPGPCSPRRCFPSACRCCSAATRSAAPSRATTTPTARTTRSPGSTGPTKTATCWRSRRPWWPEADPPRVSPSPLPRRG